MKKMACTKSDFALLYLNRENAKNIDFFIMVLTSSTTKTTGLARLEGERSFTLQKLI